MEIQLASYEQAREIIDSFPDIDKIRKMISEMQNYPIDKLYELENLLHKLGTYFLRKNNIMFFMAPKEHWPFAEEHKAINDLIMKIELQKPFVRLTEPDRLLSLLSQRRPEMPQRL